MGRPVKAGLDYFSHDVKEGQKLRYIKALHGGYGKHLWFELLELIYREKGYYTKWSDRDMVILAQDLHWDIEVCNVVLQALLSEGLFDAKLYSEYNILTSAAIQERYLEGCAKRSKIYAIEAYWRFFPPTDEFRASNYDKIIFVPISIPKVRQTEVYAPSRSGNTSNSNLKPQLSDLVEAISTQIRLDETKVNETISLILKNAREKENQFDEHDFVSAVMPFYASTQVTNRYTPHDRAFFTEIWKQHGTGETIHQIHCYAKSKLKSLDLIKRALNPSDAFQWEYSGPGNSGGTSARSFSRNPTEGIRTKMQDPNFYDKEGL